MRVGLGDDPSVVQMATTLRMTEDCVVGKLHRLWSWADQHTTDGFAPAITASWIDNRVDKRGFAEAMVSAGWLSFRDGGVQFPRFDRHNGESAKRRAEDTERKRTARKCPQVVRDLSAKQSDKNGTREEKRREDDTDSDTDTDTDTDGRPVFSRVGIATLKSLPALREWFNWALTLDDPVVEDSPKCWERVVALAEKAVARGDNPQALFANLVGGAQWHQARGKYLDSARKRIAEANGHAQ